MNETTDCSCEDWKTGIEKLDSRLKFRYCPWCGSGLGKSTGNDEARKVIQCLNDVAGKNFRPTEANLKFIRARLKEGHTVEDLYWVIQYKAGHWLHDKKMNAYLRPATLFNAEKFNQYIGEKDSHPPMSEKDAFHAWLDSDDDEMVIEGECHAAV